MADKAATGTAVSASGERSAATCTWPTATRYLAARGYAAPETIEAFTRALESPVAGETDTSDRSAAEYGLWAASHTRGELAGHEGARRGVPQRRFGETRFNCPRLVSLTGWQDRHIGSPAEYVEARDCLERALTARFQPRAGRRSSLARFGQDPGIAAMVYLAIVLWPMGDVERAVSLRSRRRGPNF